MHYIFLCTFAVKKRQSQARRYEITEGENGNGAVLGGHEQRDDATAERTDRHFPGTAVDA